MEIEFIKFNRGRLPEYRTETSIFKEEGDKFVRKRAICPEAEDHIRSFAAKYQVLNHLHGVKANKPHLHDGSVIFAYIEGDSYEYRMLCALSHKDMDGFYGLLERYLELLRSYGVVEVKEYRPGNVMRKLLPKDLVLHNVPCLPVTNMDLTFDNLIIDKNDDVWVTDYEWTFDEPVPLSFILFRSLYVFKLRMMERKHIVNEDELKNWAKLDSHICNIYRESCERFIDLVYGKERQYLVPSAYLKKVHSLGSGEELADMSVRFDQVNSELGSAYDMLNDRARQVDGLQKSLVDIDRALKDKEREIASMRSANGDRRTFVDDLKDQLSEKDQMISEIVAQQRELSSEIDALNYQIRMHEGRIAALMSEMNEKDLTITEQSSKIEKDRKTLDLYATEVASLYEIMSEQKATIESHLAKYEDLNGQFERKQKDLMTMSDWAYGMKQRLDFIDSSPSALKAEKRARLFREVKDTYKANGVSGIFHGFMRRYKPGWATHGNVHEVPADIKDLAINLRINRGKVVVVFPIIPWEFRWQRPQQIVSRFAKDGWSVLFVNMSFSHMGRKFQDDEDAGKNIKVGKLDENIYQVWLSTENRINVYQDRIANGDLSNLLSGLRYVLNEIDPRSIIYAVQFPGWADLALTLRKEVSGKLVFDCMDEHSGFNNNAEAVLRDEEKLFRQSDLVVTTSTKLFNKAKSQNESTIMVRNGTDFEMFNSLSKNGELDGLSRPIIGYYGAISDWFDVSIVQKCAEDHPDWNIILIGSTVGCDTEPLAKLPNVKLLGEKPYKSLPGYLAYFDVCLIPFKINPLTLATNPVKFYEFLSSGKPVVSVPLPELLSYSEICYLANGPEEFERQIEKALTENDPEMVKRRIAFAKANSWDDRYLNIKKALDDI